MTPTTPPFNEISRFCGFAFKAAVIGPTFISRPSIVSTKYPVHVPVAESNVKGILRTVPVNLFGQTKLISEAGKAKAESENKDTIKNNIVKII